MCDTGRHPYSNVLLFIEGLITEELLTMADKDPHNPAKWTF